MNNNQDLYISNKIVSAETLINIFDKMNDKLNYYLDIYKSEYENNKVLKNEYQTWTYQDNNSSLDITIDYKDQRSVKYNNYNNFKSVFENDLQNIEKVYASLFLNYSCTGENNRKNYYNQHLSVHIFENSVFLRYSANDEQDKLSDLFTSICNMFFALPEKYDGTIKNRNTIKTVSGLSLGLPITSVAMFIIYLISPIVHNLFNGAYILFPISNIILSFFLGTMIGSIIYDSLYKNLLPRRQYVGYDKSNHTDIYKDDVNNYKKDPEVMIGDNVDNLLKRKKIKENYAKYKKLLPIGIATFIIINVIIYFL